MNAKLLIAFFASMLVLVSANKTLLLDKPECNTKRMHHVDRSVIKLIGAGKGGRSYPTNLEEVRSFCKETDKYVSEIESFISDCYSTDEQRVAKIFVYSTKRSLKPICSKKKTKKQREFMTTATCLNTVVEKITCLDEFVNKTKGLIPYQIGRDKINHLCCNFVDLLKCVDQQLTIPCMTDNGKELIMDIIRGISGDTISFGCGEYNESTDRCDHLKAPPKNKLNKSYKIDNKIKSFFFTNIMLVESLDRNELQTFAV